MHSTRIYVCGRLAIELADRLMVERDFPARQSRLMWAYLVTSRSRPSDRLTIAEAIWGDYLPDTWDSTLNAVASRLRTALRSVSDPAAPIDVIGEYGRYSLQLPSGAFVDLERAREGTHSAEAALQAGDLETSLAEARVAMEIAARGFMEGEHAPWISGIRRSLATIRKRSWECTIQAELKRGNPHLALHEIELLIGFAPDSESVYRYAMIANDRLGNRPGIVEAMTRCRESLAQCVGMEPSDTTIRLFERLTGETRGSSS